MANKEVLVKLVCRGTVPELNLESKVSSPVL